MKHYLIFILGVFIIVTTFASCKTTKVTKTSSAVQTSVCTSKDTLQSLVTSEADTLSSQTKQTSAEHSTRVVNDETASLLYVVFEKDSTGILKPIKGSYVQQRNTRSIDSTFNNIIRQDSIIHDINTLNSSLTASKANTEQCNNTQKETQSQTKKTISWWMIALTLGYIVLGVFMVLCLARYVCGK